jgi:protein-tyrosine phosphatase
VFWLLSDQRVAESLNFSFVLPGKLAGLAMPGGSKKSKRQIRFLRSQGITHLVNLTDQDYASQEFRRAFEVIDCPIDDFGVPTLDRLQPVIDLYRSPAVLAVHCMAGVGRTGLVLSCLVGMELKLSDYAAIGHVRRLRPGSVETGSQATFVCDFLARL